MELIKQNNEIKKSAVRQVREAIVLGKKRLFGDETEYYRTDDLSSFKKVIATVSGKVNSFYLLDHFFDEINENVEVVDVLQATEDFIDKRVRGYTVKNIKNINVSTNDVLFLVFSIDDYIAIKNMLERNFTCKVMSFFQFVDWTTGFCQKLRWRHKYFEKNYIELTYQYIGERKNNYREDNWKSFNSFIKGRRIILFGSGNGCKQFLESRYFKYKIEAIIDNDHNKANRYLWGIPIYGVEYLNNYCSNEVVILITTVLFTTMIEQLERMGYTNYYSLFEMESKRIRYHMPNPIRFVKKMQKNFWFFIYKFFPIEQNKIVFIRHDGLGFGCHEKYIALKMIENNKQYKMVWLANDTYANYPKEIIVENNSLKNRIYQLSTSKLWIDDRLKPNWTQKRKGQFFINAHHGTGISLKKFGLDERKETNIEANPFYKTCKVNNSITDICLAASQIIADSYRTAFLYRGNVELVGSPRVDILIENSISKKNAIRKKIGLKDNENIVLFAPTFIRENSKEHSKQIKDLNLDGICKALSSKYGGIWYAGIRLHPLDNRTSEVSTLRNEGGLMLDFTDYPDVQELLLISEFLITDFSSIMFDMGYANKRVVLFVPEIDEYVERERDLFFDVNDLPFAACRTSDEICETIKNFDDKSYTANVVNFNSKFNVLEDGYASERVMCLVDKFMNM